MAKTNIRGAQIADGANGVDLTVDVTGTLPLANGGTNATDAAGARTSIGLAAMATAPTASTLAQRDSSANLSADNMIAGYATTATAAGTTTLTVDSVYQQFFTGSSTQTVALPVASTLVLGQSFLITNNSTGAVTVNSSGGNAVIVLAGSTTAVVTCILTSGTTAASWSSTAYVAANADVIGKVLTGYTSGAGTVAATDTILQAIQKLNGNDALAQPLDSDLTTIAGLTPTTDNFIVAVSSAWASRTVAQVKTTLALDNVSNTSNATERAATRTLTNARINPRAVTVTSASTHTIDSDATDIFTVTAQAAAVTFAAPTGTPVAGQKLMIRIKDNATARAITWNAAFVSSGIASLPSTTVISKTHHIGLIYDEVATKWVCLAADSVGY